jgi:hypothetical protein
MSSVPPYQPPQPPRTNGWAIGSLICGILGCIPFLTSLLAIIFGFLGIGASKRPNTGGKGLSIAGIVLGFLGILLWGGFFAVAFTAPQWAPGFAKMAMGPAVTKTMTPFIESLSNSDVSTASNYSEMSSESLTSLGAEIKAMGQFKSMSLGEFQFPKTPEEDLVITGSATFENGTKSFRAVVSTRSGGFKFKDFKLE